MEALTTPRKRRMVDATGGLQVKVELNGAWVAMAVQKLGRSCVLLHGDSYVAPRTVFRMNVQLDMSRKPLHITGSASYVEGCVDGFSIGVELASLTAADQSRWEEFISGIPSLGAATVASGVRLPNRSQLQKGTAYVVGDALADRTLESLQRRDVAVRRLASLADALQQVGGEGVQLLVCALPDTDEAQQLCRRLHHTHPQLQIVLLVERDASARFAQLAALGATKVVGVPCSQRVLLSRLMDLVPHKPDPEADADFTPLPSTLAGLVEAAGGQRSFFQRLSDWVVPSFLRGGSPSLRS